ncbi:MAG: hypothetical protein AB7D57_11480 [Desulfovibrionaceae bacterium]
MHANYLKITLVLLLGLALGPAAGCLPGGGRHAPADKHYYLVATPRPAPAAPAPAGPVSDATLRLRRFRVSPDYSGRELVYRMGETDVTSDFYNVFFTPPADMFTQGLRQWLQDADLCAHVVEDASLARSGLVLEPVLNALYGDFAGSAPEAVVRMQFFLVDDAGRGGEIVFAKDYERRAPLAARNAEALVEGYRQAVAGIYAALEADLRGALAGR